jgi:hypothetical protein
MELGNRVPDLQSGFEISDTGAVGTKNLNFIRAKPEKSRPLVSSDEKAGCA